MIFSKLVNDRQLIIFIGDITEVSQIGPYDYKKICDTKSKKKIEDSHVRLRKWMEGREIAGYHKLIVLRFSLDKFTIKFGYHLNDNIII